MEFLRVVVVVVVGSCGRQTEKKSSLPPRVHGSPASTRPMKKWAQSVFCLSVWFLGKFSESSWKVLGKFLGSSWKLARQHSAALRMCWGEGEERAGTCLGLSLCPLQSETACTRRTYHGGKYGGM